MDSRGCANNPKSKDRKLRQLPFPKIIPPLKLRQARFSRPCSSLGGAYAIDLSTDRGLLVEYNWLFLLVNHFLMFLRSMVFVKGDTNVDA